MKTAINQPSLQKTTPRRKESVKSDFLYKALEKADEIALYYGFTPIQTPNFAKNDLILAKSIKDETLLKSTDEKIAAALAEEKVALLRTFLQNTPDMPQPATLYYKGLISWRKKETKEKYYNFDIIGTGKSIAEATMIRTAWSILSEEKFQDLSLEINSIGDKDSVARFTRELVAYYRKNISMLPSHCKQTMKKDVFDLFACNDPKCQLLREGAPKSISYLSEPSRRHFKEILEYLECLNIPYKINNSLIGKKYAYHTIFEIKTGTTGKVLACGMRYDSITKRVGFKKETPAVGVKIAFLPENPEKSKRLSATVIRRPKFFFIQLGFEAKLKSLEIIEMLRQAQIPLYQSLSKDKLAGQMTMAESMKIPYTIIMGQKEAIENSVIVRNMTNRSQDTVLLSNLPAYLSKLKFK